MDEYRTAYIYVRNIFAGTLKENGEGYSFKYDDNYLQRSDASNVSLTLPMREEEYTSNVLFPFFDGLIPEGWLLNVVTHNWKVNSNDRFGILLVACKDSIGNVSVSQEKL